MWDSDVALGTVTHQTIGYLWPMGPFYWLAEALGSPDWLAQRLWLGSILFSAAAGVRYLLRTLDWRRRRACWWRCWPTSSVRTFCTIRPASQSCCCRGPGTAVADRPHRQGGPSRGLAVSRLVRVGGGHGRLGERHRPATGGVGPGSLAGPRRGDRTLRPGVPSARGCVENRGNLGRRLAVVDRRSLRFRAPTACR